jgi:hypothetical protein
MYPAIRSRMQREPANWRRFEPTACASRIDVFHRLPLAAADSLEVLK